MRAARNEKAASEAKRWREEARFETETYSRLEGERKGQIVKFVKATCIVKCVPHAPKMVSRAAILSLRKAPFSFATMSLFFFICAVFCVRVGAAVRTDPRFYGRRGCRRAARRPAATSVLVGLSRRPRDYGCCDVLWARRLHLAHKAGLSGRQARNFDGMPRFFGESSCCVALFSGCYSCSRCGHVTRHRVGVCNVSEF